MSSRQNNALECRLCGAPSAEIGKATMLGSHRTVFWECVRCGFRQTDEPWWLEEAYREPINRFDTGAFSRVLLTGRVVKSLVALAFDRRGRYLDFGGGYGLFVRHMRDAGLDFLWEDRFCGNLMAKGFEAKADDAGFELVTAFEVLEHTVLPGVLIRSLIERANALMFSTMLAPEDPKEFMEWEYIGHEHGQHVAFFRLKTLEWLAQSLGLCLLSNGVNLHLLSRQPIAKWKFRVSANQRTAGIIGRLFRWQSLTLSDHYKLKRESRKHGNAVRD